MSLMIKRFDAIVSKSKDHRMKAESESGIRIPTGFLNFDFMNGSVVHVIDPETTQEVTSYNSIGIKDGSLNIFIGRSQSGKTTIALQMAGNIVRPYKTSCIFFESVEDGITDERKFQLLKMNPMEAELKFKQRNTGVTAENFFERVKIIHDEKNEHREDYLYDTGCVNVLGKKIYKLEPTVVILDSLAMLTPEKYVDADELSGQMGATAAAKTNTQIFKKVIPLLTNVNMIMFVINHINDDVSLMPKKPQLPFLKLGEALPGGKTVNYLATTIIRVDDVKKLKAEEGYKIDGAVIELSLVKARSTHGGRKTWLILDYANGFDETLSLLYTLNEEKRLNGTTWKYFGDREDLKFTLSTFKDKLAENQELQQVFAQTCYEYLITTITNPTINFGNNNVSNNVFNLVTGMAGCRVPSMPTMAMG